MVQDEQQQIFSANDPYILHVPTALGLGHDGNHKEDLCFQGIKTGTIPRIETKLPGQPCEFKFVQPHFKLFALKVLQLKPYSRICTVSGFHDALGGKRCQLQRFIDLEALDDYHDVHLAYAAGAQTSIAARIARDQPQVHQDAGYQVSFSSRLLSESYAADEHQHRRFE